MAGALWGHGVGEGTAGAQWGHGVGVPEGDGLGGTWPRKSLGSCGQRDDGRGGGGGGGGGRGPGACAGEDRPGVPGVPRTGWTRPVEWSPGAAGISWPTLHSAGRGGKRTRAGAPVAQDGVTWCAGHSLPIQTLPGSLAQGLGDHAGGLHSTGPWATLAGTRKEEGGGARLWGTGSRNRAGRGPSRNGLRLGSSGTLRGAQAAPEGPAT